MDTSGWKHDDEFPILDLVAIFDFKSPSSLSFSLGTKSDRVPSSEGEEPHILGEGRVFNVIGWLDAHHPCTPNNRLELRFCLPERYHSWESMKESVPQVIAGLGLPADEPYHIYMFSSSGGYQMEDPPTVFT